MTPVRLVCLLGSVALIAMLAGCGSTTASAATVAGHDISRHDLNRDLDAISKNKALRNDPRIQLASTPKGTLNAAISASWLTVLVRQVVIDREFDRRHLHVTAADRATARTNLEQQQFTPEVFRAFTTPFQNRIVDQEARIEVLLRSFLAGAQSQGAANAAGQRFQAAIETALRQGRVRVDPRYGTPQFGAQGFQIAPPAAPNVREKPGSTTTTGLSAIPGG